mgnify:CR=1 FL=1|tara:strand:+ start:6011 stop:6721 length:711 start_codon:yes stop_codon:yes gene_type:complete
MRALKAAVKEAFRAVGLDVSIISNQPPTALLHHHIDLLFDVGANTGQYALQSRKGGYKGRIISFEPLPDAHATLLAKSKKDTLWTIHERCAIGSAPGVAEINISKNSYSSSLRKMLSSHSSAAPESLYIGKAKTNVIALDSVFESYSKPNDRVFLKIDTQGFETEVLNGVCGHLRNVCVVQLELSVIPLYENQDLYRYYLDFFEKNGFVLWSLVPGFFHPGTGQLLQFDAVFVNKN